MTSVLGGGTTVYVAGGTTEYVGATTTEYVNGSPTAICSTMFAHNGANLPTTAAGQCGPILVVNGAARTSDWALSAALAMANMVAGALVWVGLI